MWQPAEYILWLKFICRMYMYETYAWTLFVDKCVSFLKNAPFFHISLLSSVLSGIKKIFGDLTKQRDVHSFQAFVEMHCYRPFQHQLNSFMWLKFIEYVEQMPFHASIDLQILENHHKIDENEIFNEKSVQTSLLGNTESRRRSAKHVPWK